MIKCGAHCSECNSCFASDEAFDAHRTGSYTKGTRRCKSPSRIKSLQLLTSRGVCHAVTRSRRDVEIWQRA